MGQVFAGCLLERLPNPRGPLLAPRDERSPLSFFEFAPRAPLPTFATLARFRKQYQGDARLALVAPRSTYQTPKGPMRPGAELDEGVSWLTRVADIVNAFAIVLATGADLTPGERDRNLIEAVVARLKQTGRTVVFAPRGLWEPEDAAPFAARIGAVYGFDPLEHDAPAGAAVVYGRVRPMGARPRLTEGHLAQIALRLVASGAETAYVAIESESSIRDAKRLVGQLEGLALDDEDDELDEEDGDEAPGEDDELDEEDGDEEPGEDDELDEEDGDEEPGEDDELDDDEEELDDEEDDDEDELDEDEEELDDEEDDEEP